MPEYLWHKMKVADRFEHSRNIAKIRVCANLFEVRLSKTQFVLFVRMVRPLQN